MTNAEALAILRSLRESIDDDSRHVEDEQERERMRAEIEALTLACAKLAEGE